MNDSTRTILEILIGNGIILAVLGFAFRFGGWYEKIKNALDDIRKLKEKTDAITRSISNVQEKLNGKIESLAKESNGKIETIATSLVDLREKFNNLVSALAEKKAIKNPTLFSSNSPLSLTKAGQEFVSQLGWDTVMNDEEKRKIVFDSLDKIHLHTKYDVEKYCIVILTEMSGSPKESPYTAIKKYLYEHADIDDTTALTACAIYLRDMYLNARPEIKE